MTVGPVEKLRRLWTPDREVREVMARLEPSSELDSIRADFLHRVIEQRGPVTLDLGYGARPRLNTGTLRWEIVHHEPRPGVPGRREVALWVEKGA